VTTVDKALSLLEYFSDLRPEIGLSEFARLSGFDKSAALRMLGALVRAGFVEQDAQSRKYRLGRSFLRFARMRAEAFPMTQVLHPFAERIAVQTGETCHIGVFSAGTLAAGIVVLSPQSNRVHVAQGLNLPFHATASGLCFLAFSEPEQARRLLGEGPLEKYNAATMTDPKQVLSECERFRAQGFSLSAANFDPDVKSVAAPIFDAEGRVFATMALAAPMIRAHDSATIENGRLVCAAAMEATKAFAGDVPGWYAQIVTSLDKAA